MSYMVIFKLGPENVANCEPLVELVETFERTPKSRSTPTSIYAPGSATGRGDHLGCTDGFYGPVGWFKG